MTKKTGFLHGERVPLWEWTEARLYNAETMAAAAREEIPEKYDPEKPWKPSQDFMFELKEAIDGEENKDVRATHRPPVRGEPFWEHIYGTSGKGHGTMFYPPKPPFKADGGMAFFTTGIGYSAMNRVIGESIDWGKNLVMFKRIAELRTGLGLMMDSGFEIANAQKQAGDIGDELLLRKDLQRIYDGLLSNWQQGVISGDGASFSSYMEEMIGVGSVFSAYKQLMYQASVVPRMRRLWNATYSPTVPDEGLAWTLFRRGILSEEMFRTYCVYEGWSNKHVQYLKDAWKNIPNEHVAFRMMMRGAITPKQKEAFYYANSWEPEDFGKLDTIYQWLPNAREGFSLFKRGHIKEKDMVSYFRAQGFMPFYDKVLPKIYERLPTPRDAFSMWMHGTIKREDFDHYVDANEWEEGSADRLVEIFQDLPEANQAFKMWKRGAIDTSKLSKMFLADGYMPEWHKPLISMLERIPHPKDAFNALMRGKIDKKKFDSWVYANEWQDGLSDFLYDIYTRLPTTHEAFYMWAKGIIDTAQRDSLYLANGYDKAWHSKMTENYYYVPTVYDLTRIADFVEIDSIWATKILKERGLRDHDITKILAMLKVRPLRDEVRRQIAIWVYRYRYGWTTPADLEIALQSYVDEGWIQKTEKDFTVQEAELNYENELMYEKIQIYSWYFRTAIISEEELLQDFLDLGIREEKANLMVELLKAQGYYGYY